MTEKIIDKMQESGSSRDSGTHTKICLKMSQVIMETPVEYNGRISTRIPMKNKEWFYRRAKKEGIKPSELQRRIVIREMNKWHEEDTVEREMKEEKEEERLLRRP